MVANWVSWLVPLFQIIISVVEIFRVVAKGLLNLLFTGWIPLAVALATAKWLLALLLRYSEWLRDVCWFIKSGT